MEVHEHGGCAAHGLAEYESRQISVSLTPADVEKEGERGRSHFLHVADVASEAIGATVAEEVGSEDGVAPGGVVDADLLEEPAGVGAVAVGHKDGGLHGDGGIQREEGLREDHAVGSLEVGFGVSHSLRSVVLVFRHVAPEIRRDFGRLGFGSHGETTPFGAGVNETGEEEEEEGEGVYGYKEAKESCSVN